MRLLFVQPYGERGGAEVVLLNALRHLDRNRFQPHVVMLADGPLRREIEELAGPVPVIPTGRVRQPHRYLPAVMRLAAHMDRVDADLVVASCTTGHAYAGPAAAWARRAEIWHEHGGSVGTPLANLAARTPSRLFVANSRWTEEQWLGAYPRTFGRLQRDLVYPGVDVEALRFPPERAEVRRRFGLPDDALVAAMSGRLQRWKGQDLFLEALAHARQRRPGLMGVIFGSEMFGRDPGYAQELHRRAAMPDLQGAVVFAGYQPDAARLLPAFDMAVHCSRDPEPFGQVVFEALAAGVPVIAAPAGGPGEVLQDGEEALLVPPAVESLAAALARLAGEPEMRARLAQAGRHRVESGLTAEAMTRAYERAWLRALGPD